MQCRILRLKREEMEIPILSPAQHYRTTRTKSLLLQLLSHIARTQMAQNLPRHLFLPFTNSSVRSWQLEALRAQHDPHFIPHASLISTPGIIQRVEELRGWMSVRFTILFFLGGAQDNTTEQSRVRLDNKKKGVRKLISAQESDVRKRRVYSADTPNSSSLPDTDTVLCACVFELPGGEDDDTGVDPKVFSGTGLASTTTSDDA